MTGREGCEVPACAGMAGEAAHLRGKDEGL